MREFITILKLIIKEIINQNINYTYVYMYKCKKRLLSNLEKFKVERCKSKIKILVNMIRFSIRYNYVSH